MEPRLATPTKTTFDKACTAIFVGRILLQMAVFWSRSIPWKEAERPQDPSTVRYDCRRTFQTQVVGRSITAHIP